MRFHVVYRNVNGKVQPVAMDKPEQAPRVKLPSKTKVIVVDKETGQVVENVVVSEVDGNIVVTAEQGGVREAVVIEDGQARGITLLQGAPASEMAASIPSEALAVESGSSSALYIGGGLVAAAGGGAAFAAASDKQPPVFLYGPKDQTIAENSPAGSQVYVAQATDNKGKVTYSLKQGSDAGLTIDPVSGKVTLTGTADYETKSSYSFVVVATDAAGNASEQTVTVAVGNLDERGPTITSSGTAPTIRENSGTAQVVYTAAATDTDFVAPATASSVTYSLKPGSDAGLSIDPQTGRVTLAANPNYEAKSSYSFTVVATDAAGNATEKAVTFSISNADEVGPTISSSATAATIQENSGAGQVVYTAAATDSDFNAPATANSVTYSLKPGSDAGLSIDPQTGRVTLAANPNYEAKSSYSFTVVATDAAGNATEKTVTFNIGNIDEVGPTFTSAATAPTILENSGAGQVVYTAAATDSDFNAPATASSVTYSFKPGSDAGLSINPQTGRVTLAGNPDYETKSSYSFTVVATDAVGNATEKAVTLNIGDVIEDSVAPTVSSVALTADSESTYSVLNAGDKVTVTVAMDENTIVSTVGGTPRIALNIGGTTVYANYASGSGTQQLTFEYTILDGQNDGNGISIASNSIEANGGTLKDAAGNSANLAHLAVGDNATYKVDTVNPVATISTQSSQSATVTYAKFEAPGITTGDDFTPKVAVLNPNGDFALAWQGAVADASTAIFVQKCNPDGTPAGAAVRLDGIAGAYFDADPNIYTLGTTGKYVVSWTGLTQASTSVFVQIFNADGSPSGTAFKFDSPVATSGLTDGYASIAVLNEDGDFVLSWSGKNNTTTSYADSVWVQKIAANGTLIGNTIRLDGVPTNVDGKLDSVPNVAAIGTDGSFVVTWYGSDDTTQTNDYSIFAQRFGSDGQPSGSLQKLELLVSDKTTQDMYPKVAALGADGSYAITWFAFGGSPSDYAVYVQKFDADGAAQGALQRLDGSSVLTDLDRVPNITAVGSSGKYVVTWYGLNSATATDSSIFVQLFNADGTPDGAITKLDAVPDQAFADIGIGPNSGPHVISLGSNGEFAVAWTGNNDASQDTSVYVQKFNANGSVQGAPERFDAPDALVANFDSLGKLVALGEGGNYLLSWAGMDGDGDASVYVGKLVTTPGTGTVSLGSSSEAGRLYLVHSAETVTSEADILALADDKFKEQTNAGANVGSALDKTGLADGSYKLYAVDQAGNLSAASTDSVTVGGGIQQTVFVLAEGYGHFVDGGNGTFDGIGENRAPQGDDIWYSTDPTDPGYVDFAANTVKVEIHGLPYVRPLNISGFGEDDSIEVFLSTMQDAFGTYDVGGSVNFGALNWSAFVAFADDRVLISQNDPQYGQIGSGLFQGLYGRSSTTARSLGLAIINYSNMNGLLLGFQSGQTNITPNYNLFGPLLIWNSTAAVQLNQSQVTVYWPEIGFPA